MQTQPPPTNACLAVTAKLIPVFAFTAEGPRQVVADGVGAADLRVLSALIDVCKQDSNLKTRSCESSLPLWGQSLYYQIVRDQRRATD